MKNRPKSKALNFLHSNVIVLSGLKETKMQFDLSNVLARRFVLQEAREKHFPTAMM